MPPKEKAKELYNKYWLIVDTLSVKKCALIAVDEMLNVSMSYAGKDYDYWKEVKKEIKKL